MRSLRRINWIGTCMLWSWLALNAMFWTWAMRKLERLDSVHVVLPGFVSAALQLIFILGPPVIYIVGALLLPKLARTAARNMGRWLFA